ncbi:glucuronate isomerase [Sediminibacillus massiliensis]|uniref:glucuronate isomerase n=1 Tax=Sediminibacillus massiliensis TaxID=1926277 RepID=UPI0009886E48|nr:glucuronate isomerase [Sediminibacillus massiliensis]
MAKPFINEDFMLTNEVAKKLYKEYAEQQPIFDFHCHLSPKEIAENKRYDNISEVWLHGDHYKWRMMRTLGIDEEYITGEADDKSKFEAWAKTVPHTVGNPLYHWTHLELKRYFGIDTLLNENTSEEIWKEVNSQLQKEELSVRGILKQSNVKVICTTDDPADDLRYHKMIKEDKEMETKVLPAFRPDKALELTRAEFTDYIRRLGTASGFKIDSYDQLLEALNQRAVYFHEQGCRISDHGIEVIPFEECTKEEASEIFEKAIRNGSITPEEERKYKTFTLLYLGRLYASLNWVMQIHVGALRNNNERMFERLGPDTGFDSIHEFELAKPLNRFMNALDKNDELPKMIIYSLNPVHNKIIASAIGNFQSAGVKGKLQLGSGWWYNDQKDGMIRQMTDLGNIGMLSSFVGMLTDSRSFLSFTRHEYFRRILCNMLGSWVEQGELPEDYDLLGSIVEDVSFYNAAHYFGIDAREEHLTEL